jgi:putative phage-type endonuclease
MDRESWLAERRTGLGASDAAAACSMSRWMTPLHLYLNKIGAWSPDETKAMRWGLKLEDAVAAAYEETTGVKLVNTALTYRSDVHPWLYATPDRFDAEHSFLVELKTARTREGWGEEGTDEVPVEYVLQATHQMLVLDVSRVDIAALFGGSEFAIYRVLRSEQLVGHLLAVLREMWRRVEERQPPEPDWTHPDVPRLLDLLNRPRPDVSVELGWDCLVLAQQYQDLGQTIKELERGRDEAKARVIDAMGDAEVGLLPDGRRVMRKAVGEKEISYTRKGYTTFNIQQPRKARAIV